MIKTIKIIYAIFLNLYSFCGVVLCAYILYPAFTSLFKQTNSIDFLLVLLFLIILPIYYIIFCLEFYYNYLNKIKE